MATPPQFIKDNAPDNGASTIKTAADLKSAIADVAKAKDPAAAKRACMAAAKRLGLEDMIPSAWMGAAGKLADKMMKDKGK
jgi:hypothetical protein